MTGVRQDCRADGLDGAVHKVGSATPVHVEVDEPGADEAAAGIDHVGIARPAHPFSDRRDPTGLADDRAVLDESVGQDDGAILDDERLWCGIHLPAAGLAAAERPSAIAGMPFLTETFRPDVFGLA